jgi:hypothetical protein
MKITLRPRFYNQALAHRWAADAAIAKALGAEPNAAVGFVFKKFFDAEGPLLDSVLAHAQAEGERVEFLRDLQFSAQEIAAATHLEVVCRKTVAQGDAERRATLADYHAAALRPTAGGWQVHLPERMFLGTAVPPETIAHVDQYTGEYVLGAAAAESLRTSGFGGWRLQPVLHWKTRSPRPELGMHLTTGELLAPALPSPTRFETRDNGAGRPATPRRYGAIGYAADALEASPDFARTAEPWCDWFTPLWLVRQRVRGWYEGAGLKGWAFWPVLRQGSELHGEHEAKWAALLTRLREAGATVAA